MSSLFAVASNYCFFCTGQQGIGGKSSQNNNQYNEKRNYYGF